MDRFEQIGNVKLNYTYYPGEDAYSDGDIEDVLLDIVKNHSEEEFDDIIFEKKSWPITYHLSRVRHHILDWYPFEKTDRVLEIGAGCGAVSGAVAGRCGKITCVDLSKRRSLINAYRNREAGEMEIYVGNFQDVEPHLPTDYTYITLIGVFEYSALYISGDAPYRRMLECVKSHLVPGGKLLIAIENKYGLKYWAGCKEDHVSRYYEGLEGYPNTKSVRTFSKNGLVKLAEEAGFAVNTFYYPYPDYKLPTVIYSDGFLPKQGELTNNRIHMDNERIVSFNEARVYDSLIEDGMFPEFSNSFLVELEVPHA